MSFKRPRAWDSSEVVRFLREADLAEFETAFAEAGVTGAGLFALNDSDLGRLGLTRLKQRKRFYLALKSLDLHAISPPASPDKNGSTPFADDDHSAAAVVVICDSDTEVNSQCTKLRAKRAKRALKSRSPEGGENEDEASSASVAPRVDSSTSTGGSSGNNSSSSSMEELYGPVGFSVPTPGVIKVTGSVKAVANGARSPEVRSPRSRANAVRTLSNASIVSSPLHVDNDRDRAGRTALLHAAWDGHHAEVRPLLISEFRFLLWSRWVASECFLEQVLELFISLEMCILRCLMILFDRRLILGRITLGARCCR
jgi:hypothetical protein